ncbi:hypothetical protein AWM75_05205 [Aerococcus urinaehominis]|uniref:Nuclease SbcCD subunit C n=1 Tax=Aerococcus urinaehominis TaxID=128944 RepID=A0A120IAX1_9LACT|nr:SMC family ATPase [Aerococcus urinaehominis]AMB99429.1 hypothetical protein AWM75_05205 [Aerococcus urinaehominis]SDM29469.1 exonuclease SbcC [Aerococcus urinaehominis]
MKPISLSFTAFGPYKGTVTIDFADLYHHRVFLISGPTGGGKTMIFDAMVYALYGQASGSSRQTNELKSQYASDIDLCRVVFTFEVQGQAYTVERWPNQMGPGKKKPVVQVNAGVSLAPYEGDPKQVEAKIQSLVGLTYNQFRQIVLLPQGEFKKLLTAKTSDKMPIFRNIFATEDIAAFQESLGQRFKLVRREADQAHQDLSQAQDHLLALFDDQAQDQLKNIFDQEASDQALAWLAQAQQDLSKQRQDLNQAIKLRQLAQDRHRDILNLFSDQDDLAKRQARLAADQAAVTDQREAYQNYQASQPAYQAYQAFQRDQQALARQNQAWQHLQQDQEKYDQDKKAYQAEQDRQQAALATLASDQDKLTQLGQDIEAGRRYQDLLAQGQASKQKLSGQLATSQSLKDQLAQQTDHLASHQQQLNQLESQLIDMEALYRDKDQLSHRDHHLSQVKDRLASYQSLLAGRDQANHSYQGQRQAYDQASQKLKELRLDYYDNLAGYLAQDLEAAQPCPVCGSFDHPKPALLTSQTVSQSELDQAEKRLQKEKSTLDQLSFQLSQYNQDLDQLLVEMAWQDLDLDQISNDLAQQLAQQNQAWQVWEDQVASYHQQEQQLKSLRSACQNDQAQLNQLKDQLSQQTHESARIQAQLEAIDQQLASYDQNKDWHNLDQWQKNYQELSQRIQAHQELAKRLENWQHQLDQEGVRLASRYELIEDQRDQAKQASQASYQLYQDQLAQLAWSEDQLLTLHQADCDWQDLGQQLKELDQTAYALAEQAKHLDKKFSQLAVDQDRASYQQKAAELAAEADRQSEALTRLIGQDQALTRAIKSWQISDTNYHQLSGDYSLLASLNRVANGEGRDKKITFETYILTLYFEKVLAIANLTLKQLTQGRYRFIRQKELRGRGYQGLDVEVIDYFTGQSRSVDSLSGGESFKAALALALGLSEVMQAVSGGRAVQLLFIDEGFGSLDQESLQQALDCLIDLQQSSGRLIGIISHVAALKAQIPAQLQVTTGPEGSRVRTLTPN